MVRTYTPTPTLCCSYVSCSTCNLWCSNFCLPIGAYIHFIAGIYIAYIYIYIIIYMYMYAIERQGDKYRQVAIVMYSCRECTTTMQPGVQWMVMSKLLVKCSCERGRTTGTPTIICSPIVSMTRWPLASLLSKSSSSTTGTPM